MTEAIARESSVHSAPDIRTEELLLNMGPQHPSTHGVLRVIVRTDGEMVLDCEPVVGYLHRCFEKCAESGTYVQAVCYTDRLDYLMAMGNNLGYALAVEKLAGGEIPEMAEFIRVLVTELNRIGSHLIALGTFGLDTGAITPFFYSFRDREMVLDILEEICGQRLNYNYIRPGGVAYDLPEGILKKVEKFLDHMEKSLVEINDLLTYNGIFIHRTANVGILDVETAIRYGVTGPNLRSTGLKRDLRKLRPYGIYDRFEFNICTGTGEYGTLGDCWNRHIVRMQEITESIKILRQVLGSFPTEGEHIAKAMARKVRPAVGAAYTAVENSKGELGFYVASDGSDKAWRIKCRAPSFHNISVLPALCKNTMLADMVIVLGSLDIVLGEIDR
jgi:NADH-quinone oxidoreductase subunit D